MTIATQLKQKSDSQVDNVQVDEDSVSEVSVIEEKTIDLKLVKSTNYASADDNISFAEGALQQWNIHEFRKQLIGISAGLVLLFGCGLISAWAIADFTKFFAADEEEWTTVENSYFTPECLIGIVVMSWNVGAIVGSVFGAFVIGNLSSRSIYVSFEKLNRRKRVKRKHRTELYLHYS